MALDVWTGGESPDGGTPGKLQIILPKLLRSIRKIAKHATRGHMFADVIDPIELNRAIRAAMKGEKR